MPWVVLLATAGLVLIARRRAKKLLKKWFIIVPIVALAACAFADTGLGIWVADLLGKLLAMVCSWFDAPYTLVALILLFFALIIAGLDLRDRKADKPVIICLSLIPLLFLIGSSTIATKGAGFTTALVDVVGSALNALSS